MQIAAQVTRDPIIKEKVVFIDIANEHCKQAVLFRQKRKPEVVQYCLSLKEGDQFNAEGRMQMNSYNNEMQFVIDNVIMVEDTEHDAQWHPMDEKYGRPAYSTCPQGASCSYYFPDSF